MQQYLGAVDHDVYDDESSEYKSFGGSSDNDNNNNDDDWNQKRQAAQDWIRSHMDFTLTHCLLGIGLYLAVAVLAFSFLLETHWSVTDSTYFAVVSFSTCGFGDLVPQTAIGRLFTCVFCLTGVACLGIALGVIGSQILQAQQAAWQRASDLSKQRAMSLFSSSRKVEEVEEHDTDPSSSSAGLKPILLEWVAVLGVLLVFAYLLMDDPGVAGKTNNNADNNNINNSLTRWGNAFYFVIITSTTVGYGDVAPTSPKGRLIATVFIPIAVGCMGYWLSMVANYIIDQRQSQFKRQMASKPLTLDDLDVMDEDGDGQVTRVEFMEFMLVAMNKVDAETLQSLQQQFERLDRDSSGTLSKDDLVHKAKRKFLSPRWRQFRMSAKDVPTE